MHRKSDCIKRLSKVKDLKNINQIFLSSSWTCKCWSRSHSWGLQLRRLRMTWWSLKAKWPKWYSQKCITSRYSFVKIIWLEFKLHQNQELRYLLWQNNGATHKLAPHLKGLQVNRWVMFTGEVMRSLRTIELGSVRLTRPRNWAIKQFGQFGQGRWLVGNALLLLSRLFRGHSYVKMQKAR